MRRAPRPPAGRHRTGGDLAERRLRKLCGSARGVARHTLAGCAGSIDSGYSAIPWASHATKEAEKRESRERQKTDVQRAPHADDASGHRGKRR